MSFSMIKRKKTSYGFRLEKNGHENKLFQGVIEKKYGYLLKLQ